MNHETFTKASIIKTNLNCIDYDLNTLKNVVTNFEVVKYPVITWKGSEFSNRLTKEFKSAMDKAFADFINTQLRMLELDKEEEERKLAEL